MDAAKHLSDTTVLIGHIQGRQEVVGFISRLASQGHPLGICGTNLAELYSALSLQERAQTDRLTNVLDYFHLHRESAKGAGRYPEESTKQGWTLSAAYALLAATAVAEDAILITADAGNFPIE